jgi:uncharacterized protein YdhG (YjbR/CyaY superfamily)
VTPAAGVQAYLDGIAEGHRPLFDRVHRLVVELFPDASLVLSYKMPTYVVAGRSLNVGVWKHGLSLYGWRDRDGRFAARYPELVGEKGTIRITPDAAERITDADLRTLLRSSLGG